MQHDSKKESCFFMKGNKASAKDGEGVPHFFLNLMRKKLNSTEVK